MCTKGVFRWQGLYGFRMNRFEQIEQLSHLKPKFANIREEVLNNQYCPIDKQKWNNLYNISQACKKSSKAYQIRTKQPGKFIDPVTKTIASWVCPIISVILLTL